MPAGELVTAPSPVPARVTIRLHVPTVVVLKVSLIPPIVSVRSVVVPSAFAVICRTYTTSPSSTSPSWVVQPPSLTAYQQKGAVQAVIPIAAGRSIPATVIASVATMVLVPLPMVSRKVKASGSLSPGTHLPAAPAATIARISAAVSSAL